MTDPLLRLEPQRVSVQPGGQVRATVSIHNPGTIVEGYDLDVVSESPLPWAEVVPPFVSIYPQQEQTAVVVFSPPTGPGTPGGVVPFGVRARSRVDPSSSAVVEGDLEIGRVFGLQAKLTPVTSTGRWRGKHDIQISNWGNAPARLRLVAQDPDQALGFLVQPDVVAIPLGGSTTARLKVKTRKPMLRGTTRRLPFQIVGEPDPPVPVVGPTTPGSDPRRPVVEGAFSQKPILSRGVIGAAVTALVVVAAAAAVVALNRGSSPNTFQDLGAPNPPTALVASAPQLNTVTLSWTGVRDIEKYSLLYVDPADQSRAFKNEDVSADLNEFQPELDPGTAYCFSLLAVRGDLKSGPSNIACASTLKPAATPTSTSTSTSGSTGPSTTGTGGETTTPVEPPGTGVAGQSLSFPPGTWIGVVQEFPDSAPGAPAQAQKLRHQLEASGVPAQLVHTPDFAALVTAIPNPAWVVYVGTAGSSPEAITTCEAALGDSPLTCFQAVSPVPAQASPSLGTPST